MTYSLFILKPGCLGKFDDLLLLLKENNIKVEEWTMITLSQGEVEKHYEEHYGKPFYPTLVGYMTTGRVGNIHKFNPMCVKMVVSSAIEGESEEEFITRSRKVVKEVLRPALALDRRKFAHLSDADFKELSMTANGIHASDSPASAEREINNLFPKYFAQKEDESENE